MNSTSALPQILRQLTLGSFPWMVTAVIRSVITFLVEKTPPARILG